MCGRFNVSDDPLVQGLLEELGIPLRIEPRVNIVPGAKAQIVYETHQGRTLKDATRTRASDQRIMRALQGYILSPLKTTYIHKSGS